MNSRPPHSNWRQAVTSSPLPGFPFSAPTSTTNLSQEEKNYSLLDSTQ